MILVGVVFHQNSFTALQAQINIAIRINAAIL
jgi:hypothetical protein